MHTTKRIAAVVTGTVIAGVLTVGAVAPANAAPLGLPTASTSAASSTTPTPGITGITTENGRDILTGTGIPGAVITVDTSRSGGVLTIVQDDGSWRADVSKASYGDLVVRQGKDGVRSAAVNWFPGEPPIPAGTTTPAPSTPPTPVIDGTSVEGGRTWLVGSGTPGRSVVVTLNTRGGVIAPIAADGSWKVDVTRNAGAVVEVREGANGKQSAPAYYTLAG